MCPIFGAPRLCPVPYGLRRGPGSEIKLCWHNRRMRSITHGDAEVGHLVTDMNIYIGTVYLTPARKLSTDSVQNLLALMGTGTSAILDLAKFPAAQELGARCHEFLDEVKDL